MPQNSDQDFDELMHASISRYGSRPDLLQPPHEEPVSSLGVDAKEVPHDDEYYQMKKDMLDEFAQRNQILPSELAAIHSMNEEERERTMAKRALMKRTGSVEAEGGQDSPRGRTPGEL